MHALVHGTVATGAGAFHPGHANTSESTMPNSDEDDDDDNFGANSTQSSEPIPVSII